LFLLICWFPPYPGQAQILPASAEMTERSQCFGRFCVTAPAGLNRVRDELALQDVEIEEKRWHNPGNKERGNEFASRVKQVEALAGSKEAGGQKGNVIERRSLDNPAMPLALYYRNDNPFMATWGGLLARGPVDVWLQLDADVLAPREALPRLAEVARAYRVAELNPEAMREGGLFHLRFGAIALPFKLQESATVYFEQGGTKLRISTATVNEARPKNLLDRINTSVPSAALGDKDIVIVKSQTRFAGGMVGDELITRPRAGSSGAMLFKWSYNGDQRSALKPKVVIQMEAGSDRAAENTALWNRLLESFRTATSSGKSS
jgi:hypothetical protein